MKLKYNIKQILETPLGKLSVKEFNYFLNKLGLDSIALFLCDKKTKKKTQVTVPIFLSDLLTIINVNNKKTKSKVKKK